jgi:hypothetical protein
MKSRMLQPRVDIKENECRVNVDILTDIFRHPMIYHILRTIQD